MSRTLYTPGDPVALADLSPGDLIYDLPTTHVNAPGAPVRVLKITPSRRTAGAFRVVVQPVHTRVYRRVLHKGSGFEPAATTYRRAIPQP